MEKEDNVLQSYFVFLSNFSHDRAKEVAEREREASRSWHDSGWLHLLTALVQLAGAEKQYLSLSFLRSGVFLRKEQSLKTVYQSIHLECMQVVESDKKNPKVGTDEKIALAGVVKRIAQGRIVMVDVYPKLSCFYPAVPSYQQIIPLVTSAKVDSVEMSSAAQPWVATVQHETSILLDLLSIGHALQKWNFFESIMLLQRAGAALARWEEAMQSREARKLSFATSLFRGVGGTQEPHLYTWLARLKATMLSKFSLYFHQTLSNQTTPAEMRTLCSRLQVDHTARLSSFHKRLDCLSVCILAALEAEGGQPGYQLPQQTSRHQDWTGHDLYPTVYSTGSQPNHWPNVVMIITDQTEELQQDKTIHFYDAGAGATYYLHMIELEPRFFIVVIFEGRRSEKDAAVNTFIQETAIQLRCSRIFACLKPGYK